MATFEQLKAEYGDEVVETAIQVHWHIKRHGIKGVHFMRRSEEKTRRTGGMITKQKLESHTPDEI